MDHNELTQYEKERYIRDNFYFYGCWHNMERIDQDETLTDSQKEELKYHLLHFGD